jgi:UDP-2-acetamido-2,6-beta-L-arabino-hexul-4-ose reductase
VTRALVTGSEGFIGRRVLQLLEREGNEVLGFDLNDPEQSLSERVRNADFIFHFAGSNRPTDPSEFERVNAGLTERLCTIAAGAERNPVVVLASSIQALLENPYGLSKRHAEEVVAAFAKNGGRGVIFRLPNVFGPGARPNYNSVVATFAHNAARGLPIEVHDASRELSLVYVHDVAGAMSAVIESPPPPGSVEYREVLPVETLTLRQLAATFERHRRSRQDAATPSVGDQFGRKLYATYLSYLLPDAFSYELSNRSDERGSLAEFLKSPECGQIFVSRTKPGMIRGNHYHHTKTEKFLVVEGEGLIRFRRVDGDSRVLEYPIKGTEFKVIDIPPDFTHSIENTGCVDLVVLFWASEIFNPDMPDTLPLKV